MGQVLAVAGVLTTSLIPILCAWNDSGTKKITSASAYGFSVCKPVIKSSTGNVSSLQKEMQSHRIAMEQKEQELQSAKEEHRIAMGQKERELQSANLASRIAMRQKERELQSAKQEIRNAAERENRLQGEIKSLRIAMEQNENRLQSEIKALRIAMEKKEKEIKELQATVKCLKDEIHDLKKQVVTGREENKEILTILRDLRAEPIKRDIKKYAAKILKKLRDPSMDNGIAANDEKRIAQTVESCLEWLRRNPHATEDEYKKRLLELKREYAFLSASTSTSTCTSPNTSLSTTCTSSITSNGVSMESSQILGVQSTQSD